MGRLFGTDGVRGVANEKLTCSLAMKIGCAAATVLVGNTTHKAKVVIGKDTRLSGDMLEGALIAGLCSVGVDVELLGVVPTPAVAYLVRKYNADAGIMISASHNPYEFNGIKIFSGDGYKLPDSMEDEIEAIICGEKPSISCAYNALGTVKRAENAAEDYIDYIASTIENRLDGMRVALDCANGSSSVTAEKLFKKLGAECFMLSDQPDGININDKCGSTHLENLKTYVIENKLDLGIAFDGDADRCLAVDENGNEIDGDFIMAICAYDMKSRHVLKKNTLVGTVMSNMGLQVFCKENDIPFVTTAVGDRYVLEAMRQEGYCLGGEQSGHVIFLDYSTTGDGELTGVQLLSLLKRTGKKLSEAAALMKKYPQVLINIPVIPNGGAVLEDEELKANLAETEKTLGDTGRILVRKSGTEPLVRVMLEGADLDLIRELGEKTAALIRNKVGKDRGND
ncbi:MAG: phosphoglucosamine mutase [Acutalibacteraceae bacterium]